MSSHTCRLPALLLGSVMAAFPAATVAKPFSNLVVFGESLLFSCSSGTERADAFTGS